MSSKASEETLETLEKLFRDLGLDFPGLNFIERNCVYKIERATVHEVDRTPVIFDPDLGAGGEAPTRCFESDAIDLGGRRSSTAPAGSPGNSATLSVTPTGQVTRRLRAS